METVIDELNFIANVATFALVAAGGFVLYHLWRMNRRLELALAPKLGIEGYLNMCAQVVEADPDGTCVVNSRGEIVLVNSAFEDISGYHRNELIGEMVETLVPDEYKGTHATSHRPAFMFGPHGSRPMRGLFLQHKKGFNRAVDIRLSRYRDPQDEFAIAKVRVPE